MTLFYQTNSWSSQPQLTQETLNLWKHVADKSNWRIVQLPNGFFQTEYKDPIVSVIQKRIHAAKNGLM